MNALRFWFSLVLVGMLGVIGWASNRCALFEIPGEVLRHPWFIATLFDAYLAFVAFWVWVAWKEGTTAARALWLVVILLWGNPAIALYMLLELARVRRDGGGLDAVFTRKRPGALTLPAILLGLGLVVYLIGAKNVLFA
ncbi:DUF1475 domain-containing protein [bacterium]|jgi:hypothetical protein|nr:DUF1475 domain-containing protein [bacterium]